MTTISSMAESSQLNATPDLPAEVRGEDGKFLPGVSGNPNGRPKGKKNEITELKQDLELAVRKNINSHQVQGIVSAMVEKAMDGNVGAAKLILDKVLTNARETEEIQDSGGGLKIIIENAQLDVLQQNHSVIDAIAEEVTHEQEK
jgi:hypothetical protein